MPIRGLNYMGYHWDEEYNATLEYQRQRPYPRQESVERDQDHGFLLQFPPNATQNDRAQMIRNAPWAVRRNYEPVMEYSEDEESEESGGDSELSAEGLAMGDDENFVPDEEGDVSGGSEDDEDEAEWDEEVENGEETVIERLVEQVAYLEESYTRLEDSHTRLERILERRDRRIGMLQTQIENMETDITDLRDANIEWNEDWNIHNRTHTCRLTKAARRAKDAERAANRPRPVARAAAQPLPPRVLARRNCRSKYQRR
ncbi:MAG: hypothetical protein M1835_004620 [Candelina submexicana]|nr:MAG: hypothetical protein M1835_004620 [Candelina submexicana]